MAETIFSKILSGEIPCHCVYENELVFAFLDVNPLSPGHVLVIPKEPAAKLHELSTESAAAIGAALPLLCRAVMRASGADDYNVLQNNGPAAHQSVHHVHFHIIPKASDEQGLGVVWNTGELSDAESIVARIRRELEQTP